MSLRGEGKGLEGEWEMDFPNGWFYLPNEQVYLPKGNGTREWIMKMEKRKNGFG